MRSLSHRHTCPGAPAPAAPATGRSARGAPATGRSAFRRKASGTAAVTVFVAVAATACASSGTRAPSGSTPISGGTAVYAEQPSTPPNYIFPYIAGPYATTSNVFYLQALMYRPLYWFGDNGQPTMNPSLSLAQAPVFHGRNVTITMKHYRWSNGTPVTAQNVIFWLHMQQALPQDYGAYSGFPANVSDIRAVSSSTVTMTMDQAYSPTWFLYNDLSQVTPMPAAWDRTASGPSSCTTTVADCAAVYAYLNAQALKLSSYASSPLWSIVDGPWKLSAFNADGHITFVPNKAYSGPVKPKLAKFEEVPFTTDAAEYDVLQSASSGSQKVDVGYIPTEDVPAKPAGKAVGANPLAAKGYTLDPLYPWGNSFYLVNLQSSTGNGPVIRQLYFRQALSYLMNQQGIIDGPLRGYGTVTVGPVGSTPVTRFLSPQGKRGVPYPYSPATARSILASHGWKVVPGGVSTCTDPGRCGTGIKKGQGLNLSFIYATGTAWVDSEMADLQSTAAQVGIRLNLQPKTYNTVIAQVIANCVVAKTPCNWDMANYGTGFTFAPDYLPTGEVLYMCGAIGDSGGFCDKTNDAMIDKTLTSGDLSYMYAWQDYLAPRLPVVWQPDGAYSLTEVANNLRGVNPQSPTLSINPEDWYFVR